MITTPFRILTLKFGHVPQNVPPVQFLAQVLHPVGVFRHGSKEGQNLVQVLVDLFQMALYVVDQDSLFQNETLKVHVYRQSPV